MHELIHVCICVCVYVYMYVCMYVCKNVLVYVHICNFKLHICVYTYCGKLGELLNCTNTD